MAMTAKQGNCLKITYNFKDTTMTQHDVLQMPTTKNDNKPAIKNIVIEMKNLTKVFHTNEI